MNETQRGSSTVANESERGKSHGIFSVHGVRYQGRMSPVRPPSTRTISASRWNISNFPRSPVCRSAISRCCSVGQEHRDLVRCPVVSPRSRADGIEWSFA